MTRSKWSASSGNENGDGKISKHEFLLYVLGDEPLDASGRFVDKEQEKHLLSQLRLMGPAGDTCGQLFDAIDDDGSGYLEEAEGKVDGAGCEQHPEIRRREFLTTSAPGGPETFPGTGFSS